MELSVITPAAAAQLKLWDRVSPQRRLALDVFGKADMLNLLLPEGIIRFHIDRRTDSTCPRCRYDVHRFILGYLGLFSSCKSIRVHVSLLIEAVKKVFIPWHVKSFSPICWDLMAGLHVGESMLLLRNYYERWPIRRVEFSSNLSQVVSMTPPQDLTRPIQGFVVPDMKSWKTPLSPVVRAFAEIFMRYQVDGDLSELHEFGFFSSVVNRESLFNIVCTILWRPIPGIRDEWVRCEDRLELLISLLDRSFAVIDFPHTRDAAGEAPDVAVSQYLPRITGVHIGVNPRDIAIINAQDEERPGVSFRLFDV